MRGRDRGSGQDDRHESAHDWLRKTIVAQLAEIGVAPGAMTRIAFSHTHGDHVGNANLFTAATLYMQQAEYDAAFGPEARTKFNFEKNQAQLWINHDKAQSDALPKAPAYIE